MRIYTIGVGSTEGELLRVKDAKGRGDYIRDEQGNVVKSHLNEDLLRQVASATEGGFYLPLRGAKTADTLYEQGLAKLPKSERRERLVKRYFERFHWPLAVAILLLAAEMIFPERKRESRVKRENATPAKLPAGAAAALAVLVLVWGPAASASSSSALREYKSGNYEQALKEYERLLKRKGDDPRLHFNAGAAAYRNQQYEAALKQFEETLRAQDLAVQALAYYNRGNTFYRLGEKLADESKRAEAWKSAIQDFESSLKLNPGDADARHNKEFVEKRLAELRQQPKRKDNQPNDLKPSEAARQAKARADEAVARTEYSKALQIMEDQLRVDTTTSFYGDYINRLKEVTGVQDSAAR
jgi:Ca-activated chloride channel family protein